MKTMVSKFPNLKFSNFRAKNLNTFLSKFHCRNFQCESVSTGVEMLSVKNGDDERSIREKGGAADKIPLMTGHMG